MLETLENVLVYVTAGGIVAVLGVKEYAAYRLPASHRLNLMLNPPKSTWSMGTGHEIWDNENNLRE